MAIPGGEHLAKDRSVRGLADSIIDAMRQGEVPLGQTARRVGGECQRHLVPADVDVGVMIELLGDVADPVDDSGRP